MSSNQTDIETSAPINQPAQQQQQENSGNASQQDDISQLGETLGGIFGGS